MDWKIDLEKLFRMQQRQEEKENMNELWTAQRREHAGPTHD